MLAPPTAPVCAALLRHYQGAYDAHAHAHAQVLFGRAGRLELEIGGRAAFVDATCGVIIPGGVSHAFEARHAAQVVVIDAPASAALARIKRFVWPGPTCAGLAGLPDVAAALRAPRLLPRRALAVAELDAALDAQLHQDWSTARMARLFSLSAPQFHARLLALTGCAPGAYLRARRQQRAQQLMRAGWSLEASALHVGYRSASALAYALRRDGRASWRELRRTSVD